MFHEFDITCNLSTQSEDSNPYFTHLLWIIQKSLNFNIACKFKARKKNNEFLHFQSFIHNLKEILISFRYLVQYVEQPPTDWCLLGYWKLLSSQMEICPLCCSDHSRHSVRRPSGGRVYVCLWHQQRKQGHHPRT